MANAIIAIIFKQLGICTSRFSGFRFSIMLLGLMLAACSGGGGGGGGDDQAAPTAASPVPALLGSRGLFWGGYVSRFDLPSGPASLVLDSGLGGYAHVTGLAFNANLNVLYAINLATDQLLRLDPSTGLATVIGPVGVEEIWGLAFDAGNNRLYAISYSDLYILDTATGAATLLGNLSLGSGTGSLVFHPPSNRLFTVAGSDLYAIDLFPLNATVIGNTGISSDIDGLAYNSLTMKFNGMVQTATWELVEIDPASAATVVLGGPYGDCCLQALTFDPTPGSETLFAVNASSHQLVTVAADGATTVIGRFSHGWPKLLTWDSVSEILYGWDGRTQRLIRVDPVSGKTTDIGSITDIGGISIDLQAMAHDPNTDTLYGISGSTLVVIDRATGVITFLGPIAGIVDLDVGGVVFDSSNNTLYATNSNASPDELIAIDPTTHSASQVNIIGFEDLRGLAFDPESGQLYGLSQAAGELLEIDTAPGLNPSATQIGAFGFDMADGFTYDAPRRRLLGSDDNGDALLEIEKATGQVSSVGSLVHDYIVGLAYDPDNQRVYGIHFSTGGELLTIDSQTEKVTRIGATGIDSPQALAYDSLQDRLYAADNAGNLHLIDTATGAATVIGSTGIGGLRGMAFDANSNILYAITLGGLLYTVDPVSAVGTLLGSIGIYRTVGLGFDYDNNQLYASRGDPYEIYRIDPQIPAATLVGSSAYKMDGLTYVPLPR